MWREWPIVPAGEIITERWKRPSKYGACSLLVLPWSGTTLSTLNERCTYRVISLLPGAIRRHDYGYVRPTVVGSPDGV